jgi:ankyrin repeat protein
MLQKAADESINNRINIGIKLKRPVPMTEGFDIHFITFLGKLTYIAEFFENSRDHDVANIISKKDRNGHNAIDLASYAGYKNIVLYLMTNGASPLEIDSRGRNTYHLLAYRGEYATQV